VNYPIPPINVDIHGPWMQSSNLTLSPALSFVSNPTAVFFPPKHAALSMASLLIFSTMKFIHVTVRGSTVHSGNFIFFLHFRLSISLSSYLVSWNCSHLVICFHACMGSRGAEKIFHHLVNYWFGETKFNFINLK
jgi:hypothetical protein